MKRMRRALSYLAALLHGRPKNEKNVILFPSKGLYWPAPRIRIRRRPLDVLCWATGTCAMT